ncbi:MAG: MopE-related protein, partial [Myxococcota bacterium]|nr:MopE-related protein [Myxococcota bacterium]
DGDTDEDPKDTGTWFLYDDGDGYGDEDISTDSCEQPSGYVDDQTDCDDSEETVYPGADEICDELDNDCDGSSDDDDDDTTGLTTWYIDYDGDGYGSDSYTETACEPSISLYVETDGDCADTDEDISPDSAETCDGEDNDCDGDTDEDDEVLGDGEACPAIDCLEIIDARSEP